jgi:aspartyl-tRNA(Asn)/glutamyl-tRNA(Gln) amidotransferase subunit A
MSDEASNISIGLKVEKALDGIDPELGAFITVDADAVLQRARAVSGGRLRGLTVGVKDLIDTAGLRTTYGSPRYRYHVPTKTAPVVIDLERAGAVVIGKTNLNEFAYGVSGYNPHYGLMRTPSDPSRTPGGSSGGSAIAVASGACDIGLGTDTGGSIRIPAACCGIIGFKCAHGTVPMRGIYPLAPRHDSVGYLVRSHEVLRRVLNIGPLPDARSVTVDEDGLGRLPRFPLEAHWVTFRAESYAQHLASATLRPDQLGEDLLVKMAGPIGDTSAAELEISAWVDDVSHAMLGVELLVMPVFQGLAPTVDEVMNDYRNRQLATSERLLEITPIANALGWPALVVPTEDGPRQILGRPGSEASMLAYGRAISGSIYDPAV